jgi:predicted DNA binding protein
MPAVLSPLHRFEPLLAIVKHVTLELNPHRGWFHPLDRAIIQASELSRVAIHEMHLLADGTAATLYEINGDRDQISVLFNQHPMVLAHQISPIKNNLLLYVHFQPNDTLEQLLSIPRTVGAVIDTPMTYTEEGGVVVTLIGEMERIRQALATVPEDVDFEIVSTGTNYPTPDQFGKQLTERQQEVLNLAVKLGYYRTPRETTHEEIAERLDCTSGTVGEHLQRIESHILPSYVD